MIEKDVIHNADCIAGIQQMIAQGYAGKVDAVITDPPYNINFSSQRRAEKFEVIENDNLSDEEFLALLSAYFKGCYELLKNDSYLITFMSWKTADVFKKALVDAGFTIQAMPIWVKNNFGLGFYIRPQYEPMYLCLKGKPKPPETAPSDVLIFPKVKDLIHSCQKPLDLICRLIEHYSKQGDLIFDGFMGSATTACAAAKMQRHYVGFEIDKEAYRNAIERINRAAAQGSIFDLLLAGGADLIKQAQRSKYGLFQRNGRAAVFRTDKRSSARTITTAA